MYFQNSRRRGEDGIAVVIDFLLSNARLVLGVSGAAILGIATLAVKRVSVWTLVPAPHSCIYMDFNSLGILPNRNHAEAFSPLIFTNTHIVSSWLNVIQSHLNRL